MKGYREFAAFQNVIMSQETSKMRKRTATMVCEEWSEMQLAAKRKLENVYFLVYFIQDGRSAVLSANSNCLMDDIVTRASREVRKKLFMTEFHSFM